MSGERKLKQAMGEAHRRDDVPSFDLMWRRAQAQGRDRRPARTGLQLALGGALLAAVALAALLLAPGDRKAPAPTAAPTAAAPFKVPVILASLGSWQGPTDFLLEANGADLLENTGTDLLSGTIQIGVIESLALPGMGELTPENNHPTAVDGGTP